jgi:hypothetical protein
MWYTVPPCNASSIGLPCHRSRVLGSALMPKRNDTAKTRPSAAATASDNACVSIVSAMRSQNPPARQGKHRIPATQPRTCQHSQSLHSCPPPSWKVCPPGRTGGETAQAWSTGARIIGHGAYGAKGSDRRSLPPTQTCRIHAAYEVTGYRLRLLRNILHHGRSVGEHSHLSP